MESASIASTCKALSYTIRALPFKGVDETDFTMPSEASAFLDSTLSLAKNVKIDGGPQPSNVLLSLVVLNFWMVPYSLFSH